MSIHLLHSHHLKTKCLLTAVMVPVSLVQVLYMSVMSHQTIPYMSATSSAVMLTDLPQFEPLPGSEPLPVQLLPPELEPLLVQPLLHLLLLFHPVLTSAPSFSYVKYATPSCILICPSFISSNGNACNSTVVLSANVN